RPSRVERVRCVRDRVFLAARRTSAYPCVSLGSSGPRGRTGAVFDRDLEPSRLAASARILARTARHLGAAALPGVWPGERVRSRSSRLSRASAETHREERKGRTKTRGAGG